jgi:hypothetical protein
MNQAQADSGSDPEDRPARVVAQAAARVAGRALVMLLLGLFPLASALVAVALAPPTHLEIAGASVAVKPVLGQDTSRLQNGALVRADHGRVPLIGKDVGVDIEADWNSLIPSDKGTRRYLTALWDDPAPELTRIQDAAREYLIEWSLVGFGVGACLVGGVLLVLRHRRRRLHGYTPEQERLVLDHNRRLRRTLAAAAVALVVVVDAFGTRTLLHEDHHTVVSSPEFRGTTLQGTEVNGLISEILPFHSILKPRNGFYDRVSRHLEEAVATDSGLHPGGDKVVFVLAEDFEDVNGMAREVGLTAKLVDADFIALTGDLTFAGKAVESYLVDTVNYYSDKKPVYLTPGLHDTETIVQAARAAGWHVADGTTETVDGLTMLLAADPRISTIGDFGTGDVLRDPDVDVDTFLTNTIREACATHPDFVLTHDHLLGRQIAVAGCQRRAVLDGRSYSFVGPQRVSTTSGGHTIEYTSGSAGGHASTQADPGDLNYPARFSVLTCNPDGRHVRYVVVTVNPDASVTLTPSIALRVPYADYLANGRTGGRDGR